MVLSRRDALRVLGVGGLACGVSALTPAAAGTGSPLGFGFSLYGMKSLPVARALKTCADIGYSGVELACMKDWPCDPAALSQGERRTLRRTLEMLALDLPSLMENLGLVVPAAQHQVNLERLRLATDLARDLGGDEPPVIETVLGGKPEQWDDLKRQMVDALGDWERIAAKAGVVVAIKPHAFGALHDPDDCAWLLRQVNSRWIKTVFDYSHYQRQGLALRECLKPLLVDTVFVHVKDNVTVGDKPEFALPGDGSTDYVSYLKLLRDGGYRGAVVVEVSAQVSSKPAYDPVAAAERCYEKLHPAFEQAGARARS